MTYTEALLAYEGIDMRDEVQYDIMRRLAAYNINFPYGATTQVSPTDIMAIPRIDRPAEEERKQLSAEEEQAALLWKQQCEEYNRQLQNASL